MNTSEMILAKNKVIDQINSGEFETYNICDVMDWIYVTFNKEPFSQTWEWECDKVKEFCENFNLYLYEKPRGSFFKWEGVEEAYGLNKRGVVLSDLS